MQTAHNPEVRITLVGVDTPIAQWLGTLGGSEMLDDSAISIAGLVRNKVEFAGPSESSVTASRIIQWQAPIQSPDPPGADAVLLPKLAN